VQRGPPCLLSPSAPRAGRMPQQSPSLRGSRLAKFHRLSRVPTPGPGLGPGPAPGPSARMPPRSRSDPSSMFAPGLRGSLLARCHRPSSLAPPPHRELTPGLETSAWLTC